MLAWSARNARSHPTYAAPFVTPRRAVAQYRGAPVAVKRALPKVLRKLRPPTPASPACASCLLRCKCRNVLPFSLFSPKIRQVPQGPHTQGHALQRKHSSISRLGRRGSGSGFSSQDFTPHREIFVQVRKNGRKRRA